MPESNNLQSNSQQFGRRSDRLVEHYREIGVSAVVAVFCIMSEPAPAKESAAANDIPAVLQHDGSID
jgi:hypothetical protein